ncbi:MAG: WecB/TagA/CpsF family glycosyltransferase [Gammaproteobacteria bacterium]|nr:WecB/TagA/CpsF family glycosyltransferase [Gammaproteobacteria bacterium]
MDKLVLRLDNKNTAEFTEVAARFGYDQYGYVVTPNVDHIIRLSEDASFRELYADAAYTLLDSRFLSHLLRITRRYRLPVCTGSDLTETILGKTVNSDDPLVLIGGSERQAKQLCERYNLRELYHYNPPMGFIHDPQRVEACLQFIESHSPFRYCFLAVGSPQQEMLARQLKQRGVARGLALCIGASINFLTGDEQRAPQWMQRTGTEWLFRLLQAPRRMARRYLIRGPRIFRLLLNVEIVLRDVPVPNQMQINAAVTKGVQNA